MSALAEHTPRLGIIDHVQIVGERDGGLLECYVPVSLICTEDVAVNDDHVEQLGASIREEAEKLDGGTGQLSAVLLGEIDGEDHLRIIDGFHRCAALKAAGIDSVYATIRKSTWDEVIDLRILTARTHKIVQFARIVEWVNDSWARTPWVSKINVTQAFVMYNAVSSGRNLGVTFDEAQAIRNWVGIKCHQWKVSASSIYEHLSVASVADPQLVNEARSSGHGNELLYVTPGHLKVIAKGLPYRFDLQQLIAATAKARNLRIPETRSVVKKIAGCETLEEAESLLAEIDWSIIQPEYSARQRRRMAAESFGAVAVDSAAKDSVLRPAHLAVGNAKGLLERILNDPTLPFEPAALERAKKEILTLGRSLFELINMVDTIIARPVPDSKPRLSLIQSHQATQSTRVPSSTVKRLPPVTTTQSYELNNTDNIEQALVDYLSERGEMPEITSRAHVRQAEQALQRPSSCSLEIREDLQAVLEAARLRIKNRSQ